MDQIRYHHNSTLVVVKVGCLVGVVALLVCFLGGSVMKIDMDEIVKKNRVWVETSVFVLQVIIVGLICISGKVTL